MEISEIIVNSLKYPIDNDEDFFNVIVLCGLLAIAIIVFFIIMALGVFVGGDSVALFTLIAALIAGLIVFVFMLIAPGYLISVMNEGINQSEIIPSIDIGKNIVDSLKLWVISFIYMIIPAIIGAVISYAAGMLGFAFMADYSYFDSYYYTGYNPIESFMYSLYSILPYQTAMYAASFITGIITFFFQMLLLIATLRFAKYDSLSEAISFSETWEDLKDIGILKTILTYAALMVVVTIVLIGSLGLLSISGIGIFAIILLALPFVLLFNAYALGLLYSEIA